MPRIPGERQRGPLTEQQPPVEQPLTPLTCDELKQWRAQDEYRRNALAELKKKPIKWLDP